MLCLKLNVTDTCYHANSGPTYSEDKVSNVNISLRYT